MREVDGGLLGRALLGRGGRGRGDGKESGRGRGSEDGKESGKESGRGGGRGGTGLVVDSREACLREAGELIQAGIMPGDVCEIGELIGELEVADSDAHPTQSPVTLSLSSPSSTSPSSPPSSPPSSSSSTSSSAPHPPPPTNRQGRITIFKSVGVGLQDVAIAAAVVERAGVMGVGVVLGGYDI